MALFEDFLELDCRAGRVLEVVAFTEGRSSTHILKIDFGPELGTKKSLARLAPNYQGPELVGRMVLAVVNFPPRQIGPHRSEVLTLGVPDADGQTVLIQPDREVPPGSRLH
jgi:tRNA-binding protein